MTVSFRSPLPRRFALSALALPLLCASASAQLNPGDIAVIGLHTDGSSNASVDGDAFSWVPLVNLLPNEVIYFSDVGYFNFKASNNGFGADTGEEGLFRFIVPAAGIPAGTVQTVNPMDTTPAEYTLVPGNAYTPDLTQDWVNLSAGGDQMIVFQDDDVMDTANFTAIYAATSATLDWAAAVDGDLVDPNNGGTGSESNLFPGLTDGVTAVAAGGGTGSLDEFDNTRYIGPTTGTQAELLALISDVTNWQGTSASQSVSNGGPGSAIWSRNNVTNFTVNGSAAYIDLCNGDGGVMAGCTPCPCGNDAAPGTIGGCLNPEGLSARVLPSGVASQTTDSFRIEMSGGSANSFALLISGSAAAPANAANPCFGLNSGLQAFDGLRCAVQNFLRHGARSIDANGDVGTGVPGPGNNGWGPPSGPAGGLIAANGFVPGQTRYFQAFYRTDTMSGCQTGQNTSQAFEMTVLP